MKHPGSRVLAASGALIAFHIGSGFASGQEILRFFTAFGYRQGCFALLLVFVIFTVVTCFLLQNTVYCPAAEKREGDCWQQLCTPLAARFFRGVTPVFLFFSYTVMLAGSGALFFEIAAQSTLTGRIIMMLCSLLTVLPQLSKILSVLGSFGTVTALFLFLLACGSLQLPAAPVPSAVTLTAAAPDALLSAFFYSGLFTATGTVFLTGLARQLPGKREKKAASIFSSLLFILLALLLHTALYRQLPHLFQKQMPLLFLASSLHKKAGGLFAGVLFLGIYTTAVPMLWSVGEYIPAAFRKRGLFLVSSAALFISRFPFDRLVCRVYPAIGICGTFLMANMLWKRWKEKRQHGILKEKR